METSKKARQEVLLTAQQISLAKVLASNDKAIRDKGIKRLSKWITARSGSKLEFTKQDLMTIWKGLFYCMWMADKPLYQEELAERIANLIHCFKKLEQGLLYAECFLLTLRREWFGIDQHRLDKFMMLVRRCVRQLFAYCSSHSWPSETYEGISGLLERGITSSAESSPSLGLLFHMADIILEELAKVESPEKGLHAVLLPFAALIACSKDGRIRQHVSERVFHHLIQQSPLGIEFQEKFEAWKQAGFPGNSWRDMVPVDVSDNEGDEPDEEQDENEISSSVTGEKFLDPRAGKVDIVLPTIDFDAVEIASLLKSQMQKAANVKQRKALKVLVSQFLTLSNGKYPLGFKKPPGSTDRPSRADHQEELWQAAEDLIGFEEDLLRKDPNDEGDDNGSSQPLKKRKRPDADAETVQGKRKKHKLSEVNSEHPHDLQKSGGDLKKPKKGTHNLNKGKKSSTVVKKAGEENQGNELTSEGNDNVTFNNSVADSKRSNRIVLSQKRNENDDGPSKQVNAGVQLSDKLLKGKKKRKLKATPVELLTHTASNASQTRKTKKSKQNSKAFNVAQNDENHFQHSDLDLVSGASDCNQINNVRTTNTVTGGSNFLLAARQSPETRAKKKLNGSIHGEEMGLCIGNTLQSLRNNVNVTKMATRKSLPLQQTSSPYIPKKRNSLSSWIVTEVSQPFSMNATTKELPESTTCTATNSLPGTAPEIMKSSVKTPKKEKKAENEYSTSPNENSLLTTTLDSNSSCAKTPKSAKKVNIVLNKNTAHDFRDYPKAVKQSPSIPFDANKKPVQGVLKAGHLPSPINPFYRKSQRLKL
ncbi:ribosomal RNA processing protein 1 homolog [Schistocerca piceifrons]|uniref:ribosomal RNA processing protein 1 homolog n=1 Tax=Schistocerca piceifrons TaxID=274613 RepID=UPI001F5FF279|nr:ribosomal RNA processing protein 1 homolog [Schistocerca piceifrons]